MSETSPRLSVIVCARNEEAYIEAVLQSLQRQDYTGSYEVIVVDNGSIDATARLAEQHGAKVVRENNPGLPHAREAGRKAAAAEILVYIDADMRLPADYLSSIEHAFGEHPAAVGITNRFKLYDGTAVQRAVLGFFNLAIYPTQNRLLKLLGKSNQLLGGNFAVKNSALQKAGGFNLNIDFYLEDLALSKRLAKLGPIVVLPGLYTQTSARRFQINGTLRTSAAYFTNFFQVLLFDRSVSSGQLQGYASPLLAVAVLLAALGFAGFLTRRPAVLAAEVVATSGAVFVYAMIWARSKLFGPVISRFDFSGKIAALTFDDGPRPGSTDKVLEILAAAGVPATFFLVGQHVDQNPQLARRIAEAGHEIGNHSLNHSYRLPFLPPAKFAQQLEQTARSIEEAIGRPPAAKLYRPPHGWRSPWMLAALRRLGYEVITWDVWLDFLPKVTAVDIQKRYIKKTKPGSILLFHDAIWENPADERVNMLEALPKIIHELKNRGYKFVRLSEML